MNRINMAALFKNIKMNLSKHSPEILTGLGIAGMITTTILAVKATPKALDLIEDKKEELDMNHREKLNVIASKDVKDMEKIKKQLESNDIFNIT